MYFDGRCGPRASGSGLAAAAGGGRTPREFFFNCSVRDYIALTDPGLAMEQVIQAANRAGRTSYILELPEGYDTMVGD